MAINCKHMRQPMDVRHRRVDIGGGVMVDEYTPRHAFDGISAAVVGCAVAAVLLASNAFRNGTRG